MKNNLKNTKNQNIGKLNENSKSNLQENKIDEIKIKIKPKKDIKKILLPMKKENLGSYKKRRSLINNNPGFEFKSNNTSIGNNNSVNRKLIFLNEKKNKANEYITRSYINTARNYIKSLNKKRKLLKISTKDAIFGFYRKKIDKNILRTNKNNNIDSLTKTFSFKKDHSLNNNEKSWELIEKFADNFKNKQRSESLKNVLNMYKRYKSLSSLSNKKKLNNSFSSMTIVKNKSSYKKGENNIFNSINILKILKKLKILKNLFQIQQKN